jgi:hypothetical protein
MMLFALDETTAVLVGIVVAAAVLLGAGAWYLRDEFTYRKWLSQQAENWNGLLSKFHPDTPSEMTSEDADSFESRTRRLAAAWPKWTDEKDKSAKMTRGTQARDAAKKDTRLVEVVEGALALPVDAIPLLCHEDQTQLKDVLRYHRAYLNLDERLRWLEAQDS